MKKFGFTLAEVLITLSIIGVVSAITLPQLTNSHMEKTLETQLKKFYSSLITSIDTYTANEDVDNLDEVSGFTPANFVTSSFRISGTCASATDANCFASRYRTMNNTNVWNSAANVQNGVGTATTQGGIYRLEDGTVLAAGYRNNENTSTLDIIVDLNGTKGPNKLGLDLWGLRVNLSDNTIGDKYLQ